MLKFILSEHFYYTLTYFFFLLLFLQICRNTLRKVGIFYFSIETLQIIFFNALMSL